MYGNMIGNQREIHYYNSLTIEMIQEITKPYKEIISILEKINSENKIEILDLRKCLQIKKAEKNK